MELFRKKMEEQQKAKEATDEAQTRTNPPDSHQKRQEGRTESRTTEAKTESDTKERGKKEEESSTEPKSTPYQVVNCTRPPISDTGTRAAFARTSDHVSFPRRGKRILGMRLGSHIHL